MLRHVINAAAQTYLAIPTHEILLLLAIVTLCLLFRASRLGLYTTFLFVYWWGWIFFWENLGGSQRLFFIAYSLLGLVAIILAALRMRRAQKADQETGP
jgi:hypothetical protein